MGQYHLICNFDKHEFLHPHRFGDGLKLMEFGSSADGTMTGLALLLAASNGPTGRGGGDWHPWMDGVGSHTAESHGADRTLKASKAKVERLAKHIPGRWAGDRIAIIGDYHEPEDVPGVTDVQMAETGGYSGYEDGQARYDAPVIGDTPWYEDGAWIDISDVVCDALDLDYYLHEARHRVEIYPSGMEYTRATTFGGKKQPTSKLMADGQIVSITPKSVAST